MKIYSRTRWNKLRTVTSTMSPLTQWGAREMHESKQAIDAQLRDLLPRLRRFARWLTHDVNTADDLVQNTLEQALSRWHSRRDETALRAWLFAIAYRRFLDDQRRARRRRQMLEWLRLNTSTEQPAVERGVVAQSITDALAKLPEQQRHLILWVSVEGLSYREVAEILDVPMGTVMSRLSRARTALRRLHDGEASTTPDLRLRHERRA